MLSRFSEDVSNNSPTKGLHTSDIENNDLISLLPPF